jgi:hypothetical protein
LQYGNAAFGSYFSQGCFHSAASSQQGLLLLAPERHSCWTFFRWIRHSLLRRLNTSLKHPSPFQIGISSSILETIETLHS